MYDDRERDLNFGNEVKIMVAEKPVGDLAVSHTVGGNGVVLMIGAEELLEEQLGRDPLHAAAVLSAASE